MKNRENSANVGMGPRAGSAGSDTVEKFVEFQRTGVGFDAVWADLHPIVTEFAGRNLRKLGVRVRAGDGSVGDVEGQTVACLMGLAAEGARGRFDPAKAAPGIPGFRGWLWQVVASQAADWARNERGSRKVKITPESGLAWNEVPGSTDGPSVVKREVAKIERPDLLPILEECVNALPDPELRDVVRLQLHEGLPQREIAGRLQTSAATICRRLKDAYAEMRPLLEARGVDASWITAA